MYTSVECCFVESMRQFRYSWKKSQTRQEESRTEKESWVRKRGFAYTMFHWIPLSGVWFQAQETKLLLNFWASSTIRKPTKAFHMIGSTPSNCHSTAWDCKQGGLRVMWQLNITEMSLWTQICWWQHVAARNQLSFLVKGSSCSADGNALPTNATSVSDQSQVENEIPSDSKFSYVLTIWKFTAIFIMRKMVTPLNRFYSRNPPEWDIRILQSLKDLKQKF